MTDDRAAGAEQGGNGFLRSARVVSLLTLISRISGFARDITFGYFFGATGLASAFAVAFTIPNLFRRLFGEGALSAALIPVLAKRLHDEGEAGGAALTGRVFSWLAFVVSALVLLGEGLLLVLWLLLPLEGPAGLTLAMTALLLPYAVLICLVAAAGGVLNVRGRFAVPASAPILLNLVLIGTLFGANAWRPEAPVWRIWALAWAVLVAGVLQLIMQLHALRAAGFRARWSFDRSDPGLRNIATAMLPMIIGLAAVQINTLGDTVVALLCVPHEGAPAVLYYAQRLYQFPLGVFSLAFATAVFPTLSAHAAADDRASLRDALATSVRTVFFVGVAATLGLIVTAQPLVQGLFERGEFAAEDTRRVSLTLAAYAAGVWAYGLNHIVIRGFYAMGDRLTPMRVATAMVVVNLALNLTLVWRWEEAGLGAATAICGVVQFFWLGRILTGRLAPLPWVELGASGLRSLVGGLVMAAAVLGADRILAAWAGQPGPILRLAVLVVTGVAAYLLSAALLRSRELPELMSR
ncbi:MAG: murein biosynthesis integral membrane protein MurJ [Phycisphaerales bacterium]|nr:MAG: murein biosynthesis integral membrane protein MurJ [Phycisphaerales bacterium]